MYTVTLYAVLRFLSRYGYATPDLVANLLGAVSALRNVSVNSSWEQFMREYRLVAADLADHGCRVDGSSLEIRVTPRCAGYVAEKLRTLEELKHYLGGTPLPFYMNTVSEFLPPPRRDEDG